MPKLVVHGATLKCKYGTAKAKLSATSAALVVTGPGCVASQFDFVSGENIQDFGECRKDKNKPCKPITPIPWCIAWTNAIVSPSPAITESSTLMCLKSGEASITITAAGQNDIFVIDTGLLTDGDYRRSLLAEFARELLGTSNQADALADIIDFAANLVTMMPDRDSPSPAVAAFGGLNPATFSFRAGTMLDDLMHVLIGNGLMERGLFRTGIEGGRGEGRNLIDDFTDQGFRDEFISRDNLGRPERDRALRNQVQHAMAGIIIGNRPDLGIGEWFARRREVEPEDQRLYDATFPLGELNDSNYSDLGGKVRDRLRK